MGNTNDKGSLQNPRPLPVTPTRYEEVLKLDEEESWKERCAVITRPDHEEYIQLAEDILVDLIENLPVGIAPVKPDNLDVLSSETRSISSAEYTPSESSFDTAREELLSLSLLPDLLQPETLHDWRADGDRSDTDYESVTDSGEVVLTDSPEVNICIETLTNSFRDQFCDDREKTPVPQLLVDNQLPAAVSNLSLALDSDREKTPVPSNTSLLPDLTSQSFQVHDANLDSTLQAINGECSSQAATENTASEFNAIICSESFEVLNEHSITCNEGDVVIPTAVESNSILNEELVAESNKLHLELSAQNGNEGSVVIPTAVEGDSTLSEELVTESNQLHPALSVQNDTCSEVDTADVLISIAEEKAPQLQTVFTETVTFDSAAEESLVGFEVTADKETSSGDTLPSPEKEENNPVPLEVDTLQSNTNALNEECKVENSDACVIIPVVCLAPIEKTADFVSTTVEETTVTEKDEKDIHSDSIESLDVQQTSVVEETLVHSLHKDEATFEHSVKEDNVTDLPAEQDLSAELLNSSTGVVCEFKSSLCNSTCEIPSEISTDQKSNELQLIIDSDKRVENLVPSSETAADAVQLLNQTFEVAEEVSVVCGDEPKLSATESVAHILPVSVSQPYIVSDDQSKTADVSLNCSASEHKVDATFVVDPAVVTSTEDQCRVLHDFLPASQEASEDIKQLLERANRVVAKLRDNIPQLSQEAACSIPSSPRTVLNQSVESAVSKDIVANQQDTVDALDQTNTSVKEPACEEVATSESGTIENGVIDTPFDLDQRLELEATIIAAELINLSLRENEEGDTDQSMKDNKMADLENNDSSRVGGDVAPNLDENVNPFQSKPRVVCSPMRAPNANGDAAGEALKTLGSKGLKNGEVGAKVASPSARTPTRKTSSPSSRTTPLSNSPKRKGSSSLESGLAEGERENGVGSPFTPNNRLGRSPPRNPARDSNKEHLRKTPVKAAGSPPKEVAGKPSTPGSIDGSGEGFTRSAPEGAPAQAEHGSELDLSSEFKRPLPKPAPRVKANSDSSVGSPGLNSGGAGTPTNGCDPCMEGGQMMVRSVEERVNSEAGPDVAEFADGEFRSAADVFKDPAAFEFLQMAGNKQLSESALARMSLYVKFDPLLKAISPVSRRSLSKGSTSDHSPMSGSSEPSGDDLLLGTPSKSEPMLDLSSTPGKGDGCSDGHLLDLTPYKSHEGQMSSRQYSEEEFAQALRMQELLFQEQLITKDREWDERTRRQDKEHEMRATQLITDNERLVHEFQKLQESHQQMNQIVSEYERTISQLITDRESEKLATDERATILKRERDQALEDLQSVEGAFADLHRRYEKSKVAVDGFKKNEEVLKTYVAEGQSKLKKQEQKYEMLKKHAEEKLECANAEIDSLRQSSEAELAALRAQLKKAEMKVNGLERSLDTKTKENAELTNICDELIAKVGHRNS